MMDSLKPFRKLKPKGFQQSLEAVNFEPSIIIVSIQNHTMKMNRVKNQEPYWRNLLESLIEPVLDRLPNMDFPFNTLNEPRVLIHEDANSHDLGFHNESREDAWWDIGRSCTNPDIVSDSTVDAFLPYLSDVAGSKDVCQHAVDAKSTGLVHGADFLSVTHRPFPIVSRSKMSTFGTSRLIRIVWFC